MKSSRRPVEDYESEREESEYETEAEEDERSPPRRRADVAERYEDEEEEEQYEEALADEASDEETVCLLYPSSLCLLEWQNGRVRTGRGVPKHFLSTIFRVFFF